MEHDAWFFVGVFAFIFVIWIAVGGPTHPIAFSGPFLSEPSPLGSGAYLSFPKAPFSLGNSNVSLPDSSGSGTSSDISRTPIPSLIGGIAFGSPSIYRSLVNIHNYVSGAGSSDPAKEYMEISVPSGAKLPIDISGWKLLSEASGNSVIIPKGTEVPMSGTINESQDIVLPAGTRALLVSGRSPIGASFRENKCIGYFSNFQTFYPSLSQNCPLPSNEYTEYSGAGYLRDTDCIQYVKNLPRCKIVLSPPVNLSGTCQSFLIKYLNYNGCVDAHKNDTDFKGSTWRVYLGRSNSLWRIKNELIKLLDTGGNTVGAFNY